VPVRPASGAPAPYRAPHEALAAPPADTVDVADLAREVVRGWRAVIGGALLGALVAAALVLFVPPRYAATTSVLLRSANDPAGSLLSRIGVGGDIAGAVGGGALGNALKSPMETELQLLKSRDVLGQVSDTLGLQARVLSPRGVASRALVQARAYPGAFRPVTVEFRRGPDGRYAVSGGGAAAHVAPGGEVRVPRVGAVRLAAGPLPESFRLRFEDREDAITRIDDRLSVEKKGGELAEVAFSGPDSLTAAAVPNAVSAVYLQRRRTVDRGLNQRRYEFLVAQLDSVQAQLAPAEGALRRVQESTGVYDPELAGRSGAEAVQALRTELAPAEAQRQAVRQLLARIDAGAIRPRQLTAFPAFLVSPAINTLLTQLATLETERTQLLERRTPRDPEVVALTRSIDDLERQFEPLARTYATALDRQTEELRRQEGELTARLAALPGDAQSNLRRQRDVRRLTQTLLGLQAQIIDVRLAAVSEGGQVRLVDAAVAPKKIRFPRPLPTLAVSVVLGVLVGTVWAAAGGALGSRVRIPADAERVTGLPAVEYTTGGPLLLGPGARAGTLIAAGVGGEPGDAAAVAHQLVRHALERGHTAADVDLTAASAPAPATAARQVEAAEVSHGLVAVAVAGLDDPRAAPVLESPRAVLLVARARRTRRVDLADAAATVARLGLPCLGVVVVSGAPGRDVRGDVRAARSNGTGAEGAGANGALGGAVTAGADRR
jgi:tyrosine-protein kinase Etk/Wzc